MGTTTRPVGIEDVRAAVAALVVQVGSQSRFARTTGWPQPFVSRFLAGQVDLSVAKARTLALAYPGLRPVIERAIFEEAAAPDESRVGSAP